MPSVATSPSTLRRQCLYFSGRVLNRISGVIAGWFAMSALYCLRIAPQVQYTAPVRSHRDPAWKSALGERVRSLRDARGTTRQALAAAAGLSLRFVADVEGGRANPSLGSLHDLAGALDVDVTA